MCSRSISLYPGRGSEGAGEVIAWVKDMVITKHLDMERVDY